MRHIFYNPANPNSTFMGKKGSYRFENGKYSTDVEGQIDDLKAFFKFETVEEVEVLAPEAPAAEILANTGDEKTPDYLEKVPSSWTIARIYEYADKVGIQVPDTITKREDIATYVESFANKKE